MLKLFLHDGHDRHGAETREYESDMPIQDSCAERLCNCAPVLESSMRSAKLCKVC